MQNDLPATIAELRHEGTVLMASTVDDAGREAELLLAAATGRDRAWLRAHEDESPPTETATRFRDWLHRRAAGEPMAYVLGQREFWSLPIRVAPGVLIPRPDTELLVELALQRLPFDQPRRVADLGTGSGAIALALARERPLAAIVATDASSDALAIAQGNASDLGFSNRIMFHQGSWLDALTDDPAFDVIVSNPPYIADDDPHLRRGDLRFEPTTALTSGPDGLDAIRIIVAQAGTHLTAGGWLLLEHGYAQAAAVRKLMLASGWIDIGSERDLAGHERVTFACRTG